MSSHKGFWYITYYCVNHTSHYGAAATPADPIEWMIETNRTCKDGPYLILYAEPITHEQYEYVRGYLT